LLRNKSSLVLAVAGLITAAIWGYNYFPSQKTLTVTFLDVGEGLCVVARTPSGKTIVMDCGTSSWRDNESVGDKLVAPYLRSMGVDTIDLAVLSHPHLDHISGYANLLRAKPAKMVLDIGVKYKSPPYKRFLGSIKRANTTYRIARRGQIVDMGDGVAVQILSPDPGYDYPDLNNNSMVLRIVYKQAAFLLAADAEEDSEQHMLNAKSNVQAAVLQVSHHGSETGSSPEWLSAVKPKIAIISCGRRNKYGHPSVSVIRRLNSFGAKVYRTDKDGAVTVATDGSTMNVSSVRGRR